MADTWSTAIDDWRSWFAAGGAAALSQRVYGSRLQLLARHLGTSDPWSTSHDDLIGFLASRPHWSPESRNTVRAALRSFFGWASKTGRMSANPASDLPSIKRPQGQPRPAPMVVVERALDGASERTRLMVLLAVTAGLRRAEISRVHRRDLVDGVLRVTGKGGRVRKVPLHNVELRASIAAADGYLFPGAVDGHLSPCRVGHVLAEVLGDGWTGHTLRHRFATASYAAERDLLAVQKLLGHSKPETAARYTDVPLDALDAAAAAAAAPFDPAPMPAASRSRAPRKRRSPVRDVPRPTGDDQLLLAYRTAVVMADTYGLRLMLMLTAAGLSIRELEELRRGDYVADERTLLVSGSAARTVRVDAELAETFCEFARRTDEQIGAQGWSERLFKWRDGWPIAGSEIRGLVTGELVRGGYRGDVGAAVDRLRGMFECR